jgi:hypothetical protein
MVTHHRQLLPFHLTENLHMQCGNIDPDITIYCLEPFTFFDMSFGFYEPVGKVAGYEPNDGSLITYRPNICYFLFTLELTQDSVQYSLEVRKPLCVWDLNTSVITNFCTVVSTSRGRFQQINCVVLHFIVVLCLIVLFYVYLCCSMFNCVALCLIVLFYV